MGSMCDPHWTTCPKLVWWTKKIKRAVVYGWGWPILPKSPHTNNAPLANVNKLFFLVRTQCDTSYPVSALNFPPHSMESCGQEILDLTPSCLCPMQGIFRVKVVHVGHCWQRHNPQRTCMPLGATRHIIFYWMAQVLLQTEILLVCATVNCLQN